MNTPHPISLDRWTSLFLFGCIQGYFLAAILFIHHKGDRKANRLLAAIIFLFSSTLLYYVAYWTGFAFGYKWVNGWVEPFVFLFGPLTYFYVKQLEDKKLPRSIALHLLPYFINTIWMIPFIERNIFGPNEFLHDYFFRNGSIVKAVQLLMIIGQLMSLAAYAFALLLHLREDRLKLNAYALPQEKGKHTWLQKVVWFYLGFAVSAVSYWFLVWTDLLKPEYDYMISVSMSIFIYMVGYLGFRQPEIFSGYPLSETGNKKTGNGIAAKYVRSTLKGDEAKKYAEHLLKIMQDEMPFLQSELKIQRLAEMVGVSSHQLSEVINEQLHQTFPDFINTYRINEAKRLLLSPEYENEKIISVAFDCGFQNKATFNALFKKHTGMVPSEFKRQRQTVTAD